jgi:AhpD family alkylhydroperoxidase
MVRDRVEPISGVAAGKPRKRTYRGWKEFFADIWYLNKNLKTVIRVMRGRIIAEDFRERLMLAVTSVYGCRFCSWAHTREALRSGIDREDIASLLIGSVDNCPPDETIALLYAQHWADSNAKPDPEAIERLEQAYGAEQAKAINLALRIVRVGNLSGNTWDHFIYKISFGRWPRNQGKGIGEM